MGVPTQCCGTNLWWEAIIGNIYEANCGTCETAYMRKGEFYYVRKKDEKKYRCPKCSTEIQDASLPHPYRPSYSVLVSYCPKCEPKPEKA